MFSKFHRWGLFCQGCAVAAGCLFGFNTASGDVMCEEDDEDKGLCLYEGWFFIAETIPTTVEDISCEWVVREGERRFECQPITYTDNLLTAFFQPYAFMVLAETELDRMERIALAVDKWIVNTVERWNTECNIFLSGGPRYREMTGLNSPRRTARTSSWRCTTQGSQNL
ncbi:MAG: hypothetical protein F4039_02960 [Gammaproteobacteria bacterium]|nr:hypothetical protein [Gammaproteobacteria bacterium]MYF53812.1 hypothetical protein [Gammaproteobacteria bacterium]MYK43034.1 hypothetical protein [Gammaproteobacteria bacterium]